MTNLVGRSAKNALHLAGSLSGVLLGAHDLFSSALDSTSAINPFRTPSTPPGTRAHDLERHLASLTPQDRLPQVSPEQYILRQENLCALKQVLARTTLLESERSTLFASLAEFLRAQDRPAGPAPDPAFFQESLRRALVDDFLLPAPEVRQLLHEIRELTVKLRRAA